jgi:hypothetical protein
LPTGMSCLGCSTGKGFASRNVGPGVLQRKPFAGTHIVPGERQTRLLASSDVVPSLRLTRGLQEDQSASTMSCLDSSHGSLRREQRNTFSLATVAVTNM